MPGYAMPDADPPAHELLRQWWDSDGVGIRTRRVSASEIAELERHVGVTLPPAFRDYLGNASPAEDPSWDDAFTNWWPYESLQTVAVGYEHPLTGDVEGYRESLLLFADYSIWCSAWAINCAPGDDYGKVDVIGDPDRLVAGSFDEFVGRYIEGDFSVYV